MTKAQAWAAVALLQDYMAKVQEASALLKASGAEDSEEAAEVVRIETARVSAAIAEITKSAGLAKRRTAPVEKRAASVREAEADLNGRIIIETARQQLREERGGELPRDDEVAVRARQLAQLGR